MRRARGNICKHVATNKPNVVPIKNPDEANVNVAIKWGWKVGKTSFASTMMFVGEGSNHSSIEKRCVASSHKPIKMRMATSGGHPLFHICFIRISPSTFPSESLPADKQFSLVKLHSLHPLS